MSSTFNGVSLEFYILSWDDVVQVDFDGRTFGVTTCPYAESDFSLHLEVEEIASFEVLAQLSDLFSDVFIMLDIPYFSSLQSFLAWGIKANMESMKFLCWAVIPLEDTISVLVLFIHSGSSWE